jgi:hypothetical protein
VGYLMAMHLAVAIVTYQLLVRMAPATVQPPAAGDADPERLARHLATVLAVLVGVDLGLGVVTLVTVPTGRPSGWLPPAGAAAYGAHAFVGLVLVVGTVALASRVRGASRILRLTVWIGGTGVALAGAGGLLTASHPLRLAGIVLMLVGTLVAAFGFVLPVLDQLTEDGVPSPP